MLNKIHNLKRKNKQLSDKRYQQYLELRKYDSATLGFSIALMEFIRLSEVIGGNGIKIQELRSEIKSSQGNTKSLEEKRMKFNLNVTIPEHREECTHGVIGYNDVKLECRRAIGEVVISQDVDVIRLSEDQAVELYKHLHSTFGE